MKNIFFLILFVPLIMVSSFPVEAETNHALIVGVSKYQSLPESMQLTGPKYDAEMVRDFLTSKKMRYIRKFNKENITVLADGVEGAKCPTHDAILGAMQSIADKANAGDFVYLHFSGHGSRQPAKKGDNSETDGLDELFLPSDIGHWDNDIGAIKHALVDDEIGQKIAAIRRKGAFVWAVFDSCHSGTVTRGAPAGKDVKMRKVPARLLGVPQGAIDHAIEGASKAHRFGDKREEGALEATRAPKVTGGKGGFVAFYAAQSTQTTPEMNLPASGKQVHGLFSYTLLQILNEKPGITYRQAGQEIFQRYAANNMNRPTPLFEGNLDARVFGSEESANTPQQWPVHIKNGEWHIPAGNLNRLAAGSIVAILTSPADAIDKALAYAEIHDPQNMDSILQPVHYKDKKADALKQIPDHAYARLVELKQNFSIRVARPEITSSKKGSVHIAELLNVLSPEKGGGLRIIWVNAGEAADIRLAITDDQLWFLPPTAILTRTGVDKTPSIKLEGKDDKTIQFAVLDNLSRIARVVNLLRISKGIGAGSSNVEVFLTVKRKSDGKNEKITGDMEPKMYPGDIAYLTAINKSSRPMDLNLLFIGSDFSITPLFKGRLHSGEALKKEGLFRVTDSSFGKESLLVIASEAKAKAMVQDLSFLKQKALLYTRGPGLPRLSSLLREAGFGTTKTRGMTLFNDEGSVSSTSMLLFRMNIAPAN